MTAAIDFTNLHQILRNLYADMMPLCGHMTGIATGMAGLGALFYIAHRVWQSLSRAEPMDVYPLLRPFVLGLCIMFFPTLVLGTINGILSPIVQGCGQMLEKQQFDIKDYRKQKERLEREAMMRNPETAYLVSNEEFDRRLDELGFSPKDLSLTAGMYIERQLYELKKSIRDVFYEVVEILFQASALVMDTVRTFYLVVLSILGPVAFAISVYDGFSSTLTAWISRYVSVYLWLPVSDLFSAILSRIQVLMLRSDVAELQHNPQGVQDNTMYIIFMLIGIIGYFTIPSVASWIISSSGMNAYNRNLTSAATRAGATAGALAGSVGGTISGKLLKRKK